MSKVRNPNGSGSFRKKKDGRYEWRQRVDGQERYITARNMAELKEKVKKVADLPIIKEKYRASEWFEKWLEVYVKPLKKDATYQQYSIIYRTHICPVIGSLKLNSVKSSDIQRVISEMNKKNLSSKTMKHARSIMNVSFSKALKDKLIPASPVIDIEIPKKQAKPRKVISRTELSLLFKSMEHSRWIWSVRFLLVTGIRRGELLALKWSDIDWENKRIVIDESNSKEGVGDTKNSKIHYVPLSQLAILYLKMQKQMLEDEQNQNKELIFPSQNSTIMLPNSYYTLVSRFAKNVYIKISPHMFRHTFVYLSRNEFTLKELQNMLGHDESTTTWDMYGDIVSNDNKKSADKIDEIFNEVNNEIEKIGKKEKGKIIKFKIK